MLLCQAAFDHIYRLYSDMDEGDLLEKSTLSSLKYYKPAGLGGQVMY
jgi:hypothetical protein